MSNNKENGWYVDNTDKYDQTYEIGNHGVN